MSKFIVNLIAPISLLLTSMAALSSSIERATEGDIAMLLNAASGMNSANWATYIGKTKGKAYFEYGSMVHASSLFSSDASHVVYWVPLSELSKDKLDQFVKYKESRTNAQ